MALTKEVKVDRIEVVGDFKHIQVREATVVYDDGVELSRSFHRNVYSPGDSSDNAEVQAIIDTVHTQAVIDAYNAHLAAQQEEMNE